MRSIIVLVSVFILLSTDAFAEETHYLLGVNGMSCPFCVYGVEKQLKEISGVEEVNTDLATGNIWVEASDADVLSEKSTRQLLKDAGFTLRSFEVHHPVADDPEKNNPGQDE